MQVGTDDMTMRRRSTFLEIVGEVSPVPDDHITILEGLTIHPAVYICLVRRAGGDHAVIDLGAAIS